MYRVFLYFDIYSNMIERRNFYRILHVQPDASMAVIEENYRILLEKLKKYPEMNGPNWNAKLLDAAYSTLQDPKKRAAYDDELLRRYHIKNLSQGAFSFNQGNATGKQWNERTTDFNQRNYYRILQIQPDAPASVIEASYIALRKNAQQDKALLEEAYRILSDPVKRRQYDIHLVAENFVDAMQQPDHSETHTGMSVVVSRESHPVVQAYQAVITHYCVFCKTPFMPQNGIYQNEGCLECSSPLYSTHFDTNNSIERTMMRIGIRGELTFYSFWPGLAFLGLFQDLSPSGLRFSSNHPVDLKGIIKVDAPNLQAVAEITHRRVEGEKFSMGARFLTVRFDQHRGNFFSAQA